MSAVAAAPLTTRLSWSAWLATRGPIEARLPRRSRAAIERAQARRVRAAVAHAYRHVPHYREAIDRLGLHPAEFRQASDLARLPLLEREDLQRDPERFLSRAEPREGYTELTSSGTSGRPVAVQRDRFAAIQGIAYNQRRDSVIRAVAGRLRVRQLVIRAPASAGYRIGASIDANSLIPRSLTRVERRIRPDLPFERTIEVINEFRPDLIRSFGSYIEALFVRLHRERVEFHRPRAVYYGSESLSEGVRRLIGEEFGIEVLSGYLAIEATTIGFECERHTGYHLNVDVTPVRILDEEQNELPDGESGAVVISDLVNRGTVLLNYRLGDVAAKLTEPCGCGRQLPLLSRLHGRIGAFIRTPSGTAHPIVLQRLINEEAGRILRFQLVQEGPGRFTLTAVPRDGIDRDDVAARLRRAFAAALDSEVELEVRFVDDLPRTPGGKVPAVISRVEG